MLGKTWVQHMMGKTQVFPSCNVHVAEADLQEKARGITWERAHNGEAVPLLAHVDCTGI